MSYFVVCLQSALAGKIGVICAIFQNVVDDLIE